VPRSNFAHALPTKLSRTLALETARELAPRPNEPRRCRGRADAHRAGHFVQLFALDVVEEKN
jgi:hypothetical protein